jgi:hypothetical protein
MGNSATGLSRYPSYRAVCNSSTTLSFFMLEFSRGRLLHVMLET